MPKSLLISYVGKMPVEVDFHGEIETEKKRARKEKREPEFIKTEFVRSGALTLRKNNTALVSKDELKIVKASLGKRTFNRFVTEHGEHNPRSQRPKEPVVTKLGAEAKAKLEAEIKAKAEAEAAAEKEAKAKAALEAEATSGATVTVKPGKKGKGK